VSDARFYYSELVEWDYRERSAEKKIVKIGKGSIPLILKVKIIVTFCFTKGT